MSNEVIVQPPHPTPPHSREGNGSTPPPSWGRLGGGEQLRNEDGRSLGTTSAATRPWARAVAGACCVALIFCLSALLLLKHATPGLSAAVVRAESDLPHSDLLLVGLAPALSPPAIERLLAGAGLVLVRHWPEFHLAGARLATAPTDRSQDEALAGAQSWLIQQPGVRYAENDWAIEAATLAPPNDLYYPEQWALAKINMPEAWEATVGDPSLVIALIDSGLAIAHEDLAGLSLWQNDLEIQGTAGEDDDGNGYVDDFNGWDWVGNDSTTEDPFGHGTHVGGILTARTDNGIGVASVGRNLTLMSLRVLDERGYGFISYLVDALSYARRKGASIINLSLVLRIDSLAVSDSIKAFASEGGLIVAATGNYGPQVYWPAAYTQTIAVAATGVDDSRSPFSNRGPETDLAAPGSSIVSTYRDNSYYLNDGTSMAVPHVSALAALLWSLRPDWDWLRIKEHLKATAVDVNAATLPGPDIEIGYGRIDAAAALAQAGAGISFTVDYLAGQYTGVNQPLRIPIRLSVTKTDGDILPVIGGLVHYELVGSPEIGSGESQPLSVLSGTLTTTTSGHALLALHMPPAVGQYELRLVIAGQEKRYPIRLQDGPLTLAAEIPRTALTVGEGETQVVLSARGIQGQLLQEPLLVEVTTTLGSFADGSQQRTLWLTNGMVTETYRAGRVAGVAEILMSAAGQSQRTFVTLEPGPAQKIRGPNRLYAQDWGQGVRVAIALEVVDGFGNPVWSNTRVNFYALGSSFAPQSPVVASGKVQSQLFLPAWSPVSVTYWANIPGGFSLFRGEIVVQRHHLWFPQMAGGE